MDIRNIIVRGYLESLTEKDELNRIFPILLESRNFQILSKPTEYLGIKEYGKDIVAVGKDEDGTKKRFYFELKGGNDRNINEGNFYGKDGIQESIAEASYNEFVSSYPKFDHLPLKIVIVHNGTLKGSIAPTFEAMFKQYSSLSPKISYERWDISKLTILFSEHLFCPYLLVDQKHVRLFNRVLINLDSFEGISPDFIELAHSILNRKKWAVIDKNITRYWKVVFETIKLLAFVIYTESKSYNNLDIAKRYLSQLVLIFWHWVLKNNLENNKHIKIYFDQLLEFFNNILNEYINRVLPLGLIKDGFCSEEVGRYEQVGYTLRTFDIIQYFLLSAKMNRHYKPNININDLKNIIVTILQNNSVAARPLLDINSIPIIDTLLILVESNDIESAKNYLTMVFEYIRWGKKYCDRLPDANNSIENVIQFHATQEKSVYYSDSTSPLICVLLEFCVILNLENEYYINRDFVLNNKIDLGIFIPHHGINSESEALIEDKDNDLEEQLFCSSFNDGYQSELRLVNLDFTSDGLEKEIDFKSFQQKVLERKEEFKYYYRTDKAGYPFLKDLAHIFYKTPYFPDKWRFRLT